MKLPTPFSGRAFAWQVQGSRVHDQHQEKREERKEKELCYFIMLKV